MRLHRAPGQPRRRGTSRSSPRWRRRPAGSTRSPPPTSPMMGHPRLPPPVAGRAGSQPRRRRRPGPRRQGDGPAQPALQGLDTSTKAWMLAANIGQPTWTAGCDSWPCMISPTWNDAEPDTMRYRLYHLPARLANHARRRWLRIDRTWPWASTLRAGLAAAQQPPDPRPEDRNPPRRSGKGKLVRDRGTRRLRSVMRWPAPTLQGT